MSHERNEVVTRMSGPVDVELRAVTKRFGDVVAVDRVSLVVPQGTFLTLLGPSGCGKTTTLRMIGGFEHPDSGEILIRGIPMGRTPPYRRPTSMVFQNYALFPHLTVAENIGYGLKERRMDRSTIDRRVREMLQLVALEGFENRYPRQLSGGQQQRVALARSLVIEPAVLLLDEPLGALDLKLRQQMQFELKRIQTEIGITFIYVTHDQEEAVTMSDYIAVMNRGRIEQLGTPEELYERPRTRFVADFLGTANVLPARVESADSHTAALRILGQRLTVSVSDLSPGQDVWVVLRPHWLQLTEPHDECALWSGQVRAKVYKGSTIHYRIAVDDTTDLQVETPNTAASPVYCSGDRVGIRVEARHIHVVTE